jgi:hypothetical protein
VVENDFQATKGDLALCSHDDFWSYLENFDEYSFEHLNLFHEEYYQPPLCSDIDKGDDIACPDKDPCDKVFHIPSTTLSRYVAKGVVRKHVLCLKFSPRKNLLLEFKGRLNTLRINLLSHSFSLPLRNCDSSSRFLLIPSQASGCEDVQGSQPLGSLIQSFEPLIFYNPFMRWIEHFPKSVTWHNFVPPSHLHELEFMISDDEINFITHVIFVLGLSLFQFMMKHRGRYYEILLGWFH